jgi:hypothetical protein
MVDNLGVTKQSSIGGQVSFIGVLYLPIGDFFSVAPCLRNRLHSCAVTALIYITSELRMVSTR